MGRPRKNPLPAGMPATTNDNGGPPADIEPGPANDPSADNSADPRRAPVAPPPSKKPAGGVTQVQDIAAWARYTSRRGNA